MTKPVGMDYGAPAEYDRLIAARHAPIAHALIEAAGLRPGDLVLEVGAGTGLVTRLAAEQVRPAGTLVATDRSAGMLTVARKRVRGLPVQFMLVDYTLPLPFLDRSFDVVLSGLTYVQTSAAAVREVVRVLKPGGRLALTMWGTAYGEVRMLSAARRSLGQPPFPPAAPGRAVRRLAQAGLERVQRRDLRLAPRFSTVDDYLAYRRGFGISVGQTRVEWDRVLRAVHEQASRRATADGSLTLDWTISAITARKPQRSRKDRRNG